MCCVVSRGNGLAANVVILIAKCGLNDRLHYFLVKFAMHSRDMAEAEDGIASHIRVRM